MWMQRFGNPLSECLAIVIKTLFIRARDFSADQSWQLLNWCAQHGGDEFTVQMLWLGDSPAPFLDRVRRELTPFERSIAPRERMTVYAGNDIVQPTELWSLTAASMALLKSYMPDGLFMYPTTDWDEGCLEDPIIYRGERPMLGIVSHEREGVLMLTDLEHQAVASLGIRTHETAPWI